MGEPPFRSNMSKENKSSETAQQSGPSQVAATEEMVTAIPHHIGLAVLAASINLIGSEATSVTNPQAPRGSLDLLRGLMTRSHQ